MMNRFNLACCSWFIWLFLIVPVHVCGNDTVEQSPPNIILIMADDLGYETIGAYGSSSYQTPNLDRLAREGVRFEHCYAQPLCTPTRVKLMTGQSNIRNYVDFGVLHRSQKTFANLLRDSGYQTCIVGKWQLGKELDGPKHFGFDEHCLWHFVQRQERYPNPTVTTNGEVKQYKDGEYGPDIVANYGMEFIRRNKDKPFLLYYPMILTHCPFCPTPDSKDWDKTSKGSATYKGDAKYFGEMVTYMDKIIGQILGCLEEVGVRENTLVMFIGDNGTDRPVVSAMQDGTKIAGQKNKTVDAGTRVPMIVDWPRHSAKGKVIHDLVDMSDFLPTICEAASLKIPKEFVIDGQSFLPQLKGVEGTPRKSIYIWYSRNGETHKNFSPKVFARNQRYKLYSTGQFFDISSDPLEKNPISVDALKSDAKTVKEMLAAKIAKYEGLRLTSIKD